MQYYADVNEFGNITGFYVDDIHGDAIPETAIPITIEEWKLYIQNASRYKLEGSSIREKTAEEIAEELANQPPVELPPSDTELLGEQLVQRELEALELKAENQMLGEQIVSLELRLLALEGGEGA